MIGRCKLQDLFQLLTQTKHPLILFLARVLNPPLVVLTFNLHRGSTACFISLSCNVDQVIQKWLQK